MSSEPTTGADEAAPAGTSPGDLSEASRRLLEESFNDGNFELIDQLIAPDAVNHDPATPAQMRELGGREVFKRTVSMYRAAFPDVRIVVDDVIAADDKVVLRWHSEGTHRGPCVGDWYRHRSVEGRQGSRGLDRMGQPGSRPSARRRAAGGQCRREDRHGSAARDGSLDAQEESGLDD
jgi:hypothetical protein